MAWSSKGMSGEPVTVAQWKYTRGFLAAWPEEITLATPWLGIAGPVSYKQGTINISQSVRLCGTTTVSGRHQRNSWRSARTLPIQHLPARSLVVACNVGSREACALHVQGGSCKVPRPKFIISEPIFSGLPQTSQTVCSQIYLSTSTHRARLWHQCPSSLPIPALQICVSQRSDTKTPLEPNPFRNNLTCS